MKNTGKIFAFDMDLYRLNTLKRLTARAGATSTLHSQPCISTSMTLC
jgi:16S rRNA C967 or C1407 C5-methylase (RsmB/RsmF family)